MLTDKAKVCKIFVIIALTMVFTMTFLVFLATTARTLVVASNLGNKCSRPETLGWKQLQMRLFIFSEYFVRRPSFQIPSGDCICESSEFAYY